MNRVIKFVLMAMVCLCVWRNEADWAAMFIGLAIMNKLEEKG